MKRIIQSRTAMYIVGGMLILALMACGLPGSQGAPTPTLFVMPTSAAPSTQAPAPTEQAAALPSGTAVFVGNAGAGAPLDLCTLPTPDEVQAVLGGPPTKTIWDAPGQDCVFFLGEVGDANTRIFIVQAGHDADGKTMHFSAMQSKRDEITDPEALKLLDEITAEEPNLNLLQLVEKGLPVWRALGFSAEPEPGVGDWAFWFYGEQVVRGKLAELATGRASGAWLAVYMSTDDEASAKAVLKPLAIALLGRLPDDFTPTGTSTP